MANFRLSYFFLSPNSEGWSENYYWQGADITSAKAELDSLLNLRKAMLPTTFEVVGARASDVSVRGNVAFSNNVFPILGTYTIPAGAVALEANTAIVQQFLATAPRYAKFYLRGLTSAVIHGRSKVAEATFDTAFNAWKTAVAGGAFLARHRLTPPPHATYSYSPMTNFGSTLVSARKPGRPFDLLRGRR